MGKGTFFRVAVAVGLTYLALEACETITSAHERGRDPREALGQAQSAELAVIKEDAMKKRAAFLEKYSKHAGTPELSLNAYLESRHYYDGLMKEVK